MANYVSNIVLSLLFIAYFFQAYLIYSENYELKDRLKEQNKLINELFDEVWKLKKRGSNV